VVGINTAIIAQGQGIGLPFPSTWPPRSSPAQGERGGHPRLAGSEHPGPQGRTGRLLRCEEFRGRAGDDVVPGNPAEKAGIKANDIITRSTAIRSKTRELTAKAATLPVGETTKITVVREGKEKTFDVKVATTPDRADAGKPQVEKEGEYGLQVTDLTPRWPSA